MLQITMGLAIAACDVLVGSADVGAGTATLVIYSGTKPATVATALTGQVALVSFDLPNPAFGNAADAATKATATANTIPDATAGADGTAAFFRIFDRDGNAVIQGDVSEVDGGGDLELPTVTIVNGGSFGAAVLTASMPTG